MHQWTIELKRDADYWEDELTVRDNNGSLVMFADAWITFHPDKGENDVVYDDVVWSVDNGKLRIISDGVFGFEVPLEEIAAYEWSRGNFCWSVKYTDGHRDWSWYTGRVTIKVACR